MTDGKWQLSALSYSRVNQSPEGILLGLGSLQASKLLQEMMCGSTARGGTVRNEVVLFTNFIDRKVDPPTSNLINFINKVHTTYVIVTFS